ncbi:Serine/threonine-protein kinase B [Fuerstiella marisgermanici]|uniref:Serine/threonine-protein kinase B n=2 Tax=Fuerstiella marisgermanici TaxID=1891926 RepID=A0A1P8WMM7_9PLAN|nr:Serine/threonine-protein kinase B [Fuerstiella marisgermanici]
MTKDSDTPNSSSTLAPPSSAQNMSRWSIAGIIAAIVLAALLTWNLRLVVVQLSDAADISRERAFWALCHPETTPQQRTEFFLRLAAGGNAEWKSALLHDLQLSGVDLSNTSLESAVFTSCNFAKVNFESAQLGRASLDTSDLTGANFAKVKLRNGTFFKSNLKNADFRNADLLSTSFEQATAHDAVFVAAKMGDAFFAMTDLTGADFTGAELSGANFEAAILKNADLALANLYTARLNDADLTDSNWWRARGLASQQLDEFTLRFPPTPDAPESRQRDFEIWLTKRIEDSEQPNPGQK